MAKPLSEDLRIRLIVAVEAGMSRRAAAERFGVAVASAVRWVRAWRATGATCARPQGGDQRSHRIEAFKDVILASIDAQVDVTLVELAELLHAEHGAAFAPSTIWRFLDRHGITFKKNRARQRATASRRRGPAGGVVRRPARPRSRASGLHR
jgi:transposase